MLRFWTPKTKGLHRRCGSAHVGEEGEFGEECHVDLADTTLTVLCDDDFGDALGLDLLRELGRGFGEEQHNIGILLDCSRLTEVAESGPLVFTRLDSTVQL